MQAVLIEKHGGLEGLAFRDDVPRPQMAPGEVLLRVGATSLNYHDLFTLRGMPGITLPLPVVPGLDVAGEVVEAGPSVEGWQAGDRALVFPLSDDFELVGETRDGGLAEFIAVPASQLIRLPDEVSYSSAAALPVAYGTAYRMIVEKQTIHAGDRVLVLGASGGVGTAAVLLAKTLGAEVIAAVGSEEKARALQDLGADHVVNYKSEDVFAWVRQKFGKPSRSSTEGGVDVVVNFTGGDTWRPTLKVVRLGGRILVCGATAGFDPVEDLRYIWSFELQIIGSNGFTKEGIERLVELVAAGRLEPVVSEVHGLEGAIDALAALEARQVLGKFVILPHDKAQA